MLSLFPYILLAILGATLASFAVAQVWRLRARQLQYDKKAGEKVDAAELKRLKPLLESVGAKDRSRCLSCKHQLAWYDLIPLASWLMLRGRCRYCHSSIGYTEFLAEVTLAALFIVSYLWWPGSLGSAVEVTRFALWLAALVVLTINFIYDLRWSLLVPFLNWLLIGLGLIYAVMVSVGSGDMMGSLVSTGIGIMILGGLYGLLWLVSHGRWVGEGDIYLGAGLALFLTDYKMAFLALFLANLIGTVILLPSMIAGKVGRGMQVPFGPMLIAGSVATWFIGEQLIAAYMSLFSLS